MRKAKYTKPVSLNIDEKIYQALKKQSDEYEISLAEMIRDLIMHALKKDEPVIFGPPKDNKDE